MLKVSVVIPTYNGNEYLVEAIQSVIDQTYPHFEIIVVDDASPEELVDLKSRFSDTRIKLIRHENNRGAVAARHTGTIASSGDIIMFLDQDDLFHREKLSTHVIYLQDHPEIGASYNARYEIFDTTKTISGIYFPPKTLLLVDLVLGYPISPSDTVLRREWALRDEIWDDSFALQAEHKIFNGHEIIFGSRLVLAGCQFGNVGRALNYRRFHSLRKLKHLAARCQSELSCQQIVFKDPRCPQNVLKLQNEAFSNIYLMFAYNAFIQDECDLGREFLIKAVELKPSLLNGKPRELIKAWAAWAAKDSEHFGQSHEIIINSIINNLPPDLKIREEERDWAIAKGYLWKGMFKIIWGSQNDALDHLNQARQLGSVFDESSAQMFIGDLLAYEGEFGSETGLEILHRLSSFLDKAGDLRGRNLIEGTYWINHAFNSYNAHEYDRALQDVFRGVKNNYKFLGNRGVRSILAHSLAGILRN